MTAACHAARRRAEPERFIPIVRLNRNETLAGYTDYAGLASK
jgi:hypothetical protein